MNFPRVLTLATDLDDPSDYEVRVFYADFFVSIFDDHLTIDDYGNQTAEEVIRNHLCDVDDDGHFMAEGTGDWEEHA